MRRVRAARGRIAFVAAAIVAAAIIAAAIAVAATAAAACRGAEESPAPAASGATASPPAPAPRPARRAADWASEPPRPAREAEAARSIETWHQRLDQAAAGRAIVMAVVERLADAAVRVPRRYTLDAHVVESTGLLPRHIRIVQAPSARPPSAQPALRPDPDGRYLVALAPTGNPDTFALIADPDAGLFGYGLEIQEGRYQIPGGPGDVSFTDVAEMR